MSKVDKDKKDLLQVKVPVMVGDIVPEVHLRNMRIVNRVRDRIEKGELDNKAQGQHKKLVDDMFAEEEAKEPPYVPPVAPV